MPSVIALDAMGSDRAPRPEIEGAVHAARHSGTRVLLIGPEEQLKAEMSRYRWSSQLPIEIVHASEVITMEDKAAQAVRSKRDSPAPPWLPQKWCWARYREWIGLR
jgi:glycerol-3-phosphate acyltransferase PlsX